MKKFLCYLSLCLVGLFLFVGCGIEGSTEPSAIEFVQDVFYIDKDIRTFLDYKIYPSTARHPSVSYDSNADESIKTSYEFRDGYIHIWGDNFKPFDVTVILGNLEDTCEVRLRQYPSSIGFYDDLGAEKTSDVVYAGLDYSLDLKAMFDGQLRSVENNEFNYEIITTNPDVIEVKNEQQLLLHSTGRRGSSSITVIIKDSLGNEVPGLRATIKLSVLETIDSWYLTVGERALNNGDTLSVSAEAGHQLEIVARAFDRHGFLIEGGFQLFTSNKNVAVIRTEEGKTYLEFVGAGNCDLTLISSTVDGDGNPVKIVIKLQVQILE